MAARVQPSDAGRRHLYGPTLLIGLLGAIGVSVGGSRPWISATSHVPGLPTIQATASGADLAPLAGALGLVVLAAFGAVVATRGWVRRTIGAAIVVASVVVLAAVIDPGGSREVITSGLSAKGWAGGGFETRTELWRWLVLISSVATGLAGATTAWYGAHWAVMGSRYDAPGGASPKPTSDKPPEELTESDVWQAIDQGRDPTQGP